ncbi:flagellar biosynthesis protein FliR [Herbaspirillum frisingense GSF30]|uniref:Flagellar biosynthetic protein FliR n=1 Tax=Herbaspirillum frisingense GSF30 TaxID=864073 RepID=A0AAI9IGF7_9BURK|nr:flagellar biosynthetic protein FliR [Herbaspirillum frisingense]EOA05564.1 flagellar biosynthesis protein FliR [Herbaspirillum frisingense GSF30]
MLTFSSQQLYTWVAMFIWPTTRILGLLSIAPPFGSASVPMLVKVLLGIAIGAVLAPDVPVPPAIDPMSMTGLLILLQQLLIGLSMGLAMRVVFAAVEAAGELTSSTMGLSFAAFFDPQSQGRTAVISQVLSLLATMVFLSLNGHLLLLQVMAESFHTLPITGQPITTEGFHQLVLWGAKVFSMGVQLSLPLLIALLITNFALGILTRAAPQLNLFGIGFSITMLSGFILIAFALPYMLTPLQRLLSDGIEMVRLLGSVPPVNALPKP